MATGTIALSRTYASEATDVEKRIRENKALVEILRGEVEHVRFVVWENSLFPDADCGLLYGAMKMAFKNDVFVSVRKGGGDPFVGVLNSQSAEIEEEEYEWILVISATSGHMITSRVMECVLCAITEHDVDAIGIVPPDVPSVGQGAITNQIAFWRLSFLRDIRWFDRFDTRPVVFDYTHDYQGVGELMNLFKSKRRQPLAVIYPDVEVGDARTAAEDPKQMLKLQHKERRINMVLNMARKSKRELAGLIHEGYPIDLRQKKSAA